MTGVLGSGGTGCAGLSDAEQRADTGTAWGAAGGAIIGTTDGNSAMGAVIGTGAGLVGGLLVDKVQKDKKAACRAGLDEGRSGG